MSKQYFYNDKNLNIIRFSAYSKIYIKDNQMLILRNDNQQKLVLECSENGKLNYLYQLLMDGIDRFSEQFKELFEKDNAMKTWLEMCLEKGLIE